MLPQVKTTKIKLTNNQVAMSITVNKVGVASSKSEKSEWSESVRESSRLYAR